MLQSSRLEDNMNTIGIDQSSFTRSTFEQKCINNIKKIYQHAGTCDDQQNLKDIPDADMVSTPEGLTDNSPNVPITSSTVKKPSSRKSLYLITKILDVKPKPENCPFVAAKSKRIAIKVDNSLWTKKTKRKGHAEINEQIKFNFHAWRTLHPQVVQ